MTVLKETTPCHVCGTIISVGVVPFNGITCSKECARVQSFISSVQDITQPLLMHLENLEYNMRNR